MRRKFVFLVARSLCRADDARRHGASAGIANAEGTARQGHLLRRESLLELQPVLRHVPRPGGGMDWSGLPAQRARSGVRRVDPGAFGDRKPPSAAYATQSPVFHLEKKGLFVGGNFWDGRATGRNPGEPGGRTGQRPVPEPCGAGAARCRGARRAGLRRYVRQPLQGGLGSGESATLPNVAMATTASGTRSPPTRRRGGERVHLEVRQQQEGAWRS